MYGVYEHWGIWTPPKSDNPLKIGKDRINSKISLVFLHMFCLLISKIEQLHVVTGLNMVCLQELAL